MEQTGIYCLYCKTGYEKNVEKTLLNKGFSVIRSMTERNVVKKGKTVKTVRPILPGYVFFEHGTEPLWRELKKENNIFYPLAYSDSTKKLRNVDLKFVKWLKNKKGILKISKAVEEGKRIRIIDGPLKDYAGRIKKINKNRKCVEVEIETEKIINKIWLSYELIAIQEKDE
jgi:transcriptional antiterminator NusG